jgi:hypothetical protein
MKQPTLWREAEKLIGEDGALQMVDPLYVIETCMRYFYSLAQTGRKANAPLDEMRICDLLAVRAAHWAARPRKAVALASGGHRLSSGGRRSRIQRRY